ncbi:MAG: beta-glucosidase [Cytophagales bacterium]|nr:MAG: beta-glucosidase [Cytophagales bacterium]
MNISSEFIKDGISPLQRKKFGNEFQWGVSVSAYQIEGAHDKDGKGLSIWDVFTNKKGKVFNNQNGNIACDFYHRSSDDLQLIQQLSIPNFRFSISWPRILPQGTGQVNAMGIAYYDRLIDECLSLGIEPWVTLYHWDLPHALELKGGWTNRDIVSWFVDFVAICVQQYGDKVKNWMVLNEPMVFTGAGYFLGVHAPGRRGMSNFLPAAHHAVLAMAEGARTIRAICPQANIGTTFSCSHIEPYSNKEKDILAAKRVDALLNRLFIEPTLGLGYPTQDLPALRKIEKYILANDDKLMKFDFDFIGIQNYTREIVKHSYFTPYLRASIVKATKRKVPTTLMNWEVYPSSIYHILKKYDAYEGIKKIYITENGAAFTDYANDDGSVEDHHRKEFLQNYLKELLKAKEEGVKVEGYFIWTLKDNFEWAEGFHPRFGIIYVDFKTQQRTIKASGWWYKEFLEETNRME